MDKKQATAKVLWYNQFLAYVFVSLQLYYYRVFVLLNTRKPSKLTLTLNHCTPTRHAITSRWWSRFFFDEFSVVNSSSHFLEWKYFNFKQYFIGKLSLGSNLQYVGIGSDNGLAPSRRQAIILTNVDPVHRRIYAALGVDGLNWCTTSITWNYFVVYIR